MLLFWHCPGTYTWLTRLLSCYVCVRAPPCVLAQMDSEIQRVKKLIPASVREAQFFRVRTALS